MGRWATWWDDFVEWFLGTTPPVPTFEQQIVERLDQVDMQLTAINHLVRTVLVWEERIMSAVQIEQGDLDAVAAALESLVGVIAGIDTTVLPAADETALNTALADVTAAINGKLPVTTPVSTPSGTDSPPADTGTPSDGTATT